MLSVDDKLWQREQRDLAIKQVHERYAQAEERKKEQKRELEKFGVQQQMNVGLRLIIFSQMNVLVCNLDSVVLNFCMLTYFQLEDKDRSRIENIKTTERQKAMAELDEWKRHQESLAQQVK